jgi:hypothetical protein
MLTEMGVMCGFGNFAKFHAGPMLHELRLAAGLQATHRQWHH